MLQLSSESGEDCFGGILEPRWSNFLRGKPVFSTWPAVMRLLSRKSCSSEKSRAKQHPDGRHFLKVLYENHPKIKNKPKPELNYTIKLSEGLQNLGRPSL
jgi:hypothetical protein